MNLNYVLLGQHTKTIRTTLGLTRRDVHQDTGLSLETIRRLEIGREPKISTLEILSEYYKFDLLDALIQCRTDSNLFSSNIIEDVISFMRNMDDEGVANAIDYLIREIEPKSKIHPNVKYLSIFLESLKSIRHNKTIHGEVSIISIEQLLFGLSRRPSVLISDPFLSDLETFITIFLAVLLRRSNQVTKSITLLESLLNKINDYPLLGSKHLNFIVTINLNLSYAYHYFDDHEKVIEIVDSTLNNSQLTFSNTTYHDLLLRKAHAFYEIGNPAYKAILETIMLNETTERIHQIAGIAESKFHITLLDS